MYHTKGLECVTGLKGRGGGRGGVIGGDGGGIGGVCGDGDGDGGGIGGGGDKDRSKREREPEWLPSGYKSTPPHCKARSFAFSSVSIIQCAFSICANLHFTFPCFACFAFAPGGTLVECTHDDG